jgi:heme/copper-type cytochrome/quinol oxidase subunit 2
MTGERQTPRSVGNSSGSNTWTKRFAGAAVIQGAIITGLTIFLLLSQISLLKPEISRVIAAGNAGTWFTFGYVMYIIIGVIGVAVSSLFYHYLENTNREQMQKRVAKVLAWIHLVLMNVGTTAAMSMLMYVGYLGGAAMLPQSIGGKGFNAGQAHEILGPFVEPISAAILVIVAGVIAGGIGFILSYRAELSAEKPSSLSSSSKERSTKGETAAA